MTQPAHVRCTAQHVHNIRAVPCNMHTAPTSQTELEKYSTFARVMRVSTRVTRDYIAMHVTARNYVLCKTDLCYKKGNSLDKQCKTIHFKTV